MALPLAGPPLTPRPVPVTPTEERWRAMTPAERERFIVSVNEALSDRLIRRLEGIVANLQERAEQAARDAEEAQQEAERNRGAVRDAIRAVLRARGVTCSAQAVARLDACADPDVLRRWLDRALHATSEFEVFAADSE